MLELAHPRHRVAHAACLKVRQRQLQQMAKQPRAQLHIDAAGGVAEHIGSQRAECAFEHHHDQQPDHQHVERGEAPVHQHLVHHHLKEQRAHQCEQLQKQADQQHLAQQSPVLHQAGYEPAEIEYRQLTGQRGAAGDQDELARPPGGEHLQRLDGWSCAGSRAGVLIKNSLAVALRQHDDAQSARLVFCAQHSECRQRHQTQTIGTAAAEPGLEAQLARRQQQVSAVGLVI